MTTEQLEQELNRASDGLLMLSETDAPFEVFVHEQPAGNELTHDDIVKLAGKPSDYGVKVEELDYFFRNMTNLSDAEEPQKAEQAQRFRNLQNTLQNLLTDVKVYRVGERNISVFILGKTADGTIAGLKTLVIET
ncbi:nuclease A inhibitor family protein [Pontibacter arcticus]|uniref:Sugar-non-specific nuclease inhibitor NuiA-like protein n=1 Tax=Pontibacter arcticus TaxID=2080288 RepID=A0A364RFL0_9BACT|nr:nuclease A inhibitor family protein [Pontibacter arcticus]RAU83138.1 sugar-non-specific nuclease inhibitor NuiA-like protein [Pontibacter arcticus]